MGHSFLFYFFFCCTRSGGGGGFFRFGCRYSSFFMVASAYSLTFSRTFRVIFSLFVTTTTSIDFFFFVVVGCGCFFLVALTRPLVPF